MQKPLKELLVKGIGKNDIVAIATVVAEDENMFLELLDIIQANDETPAMKAAWIIGTISDKKQTKLIEKNASTILALVTSKNNGGVVRELMKALTASNLNDKLTGSYLDFCFRQLTRSDIDVAVKYNANKFIEKSLKKYPELKPEFISILESLLDNHNEAWKKYTSRTIARLSKQNPKLKY